MNEPDPWQTEFDALETAREASHRRHGAALHAVMQWMQPHGSGVIPPNATAELKAAGVVRDKDRAALDDWEARFKRHLEGS